MNYEEKNKIYQRAKRIVASDLDWTEKYDMIFSDEISLKFKLNYYDPDCGYEDDIIAFMNALDEYMEKQLLIKKQIDY